MSKDGRLGVVSLGEPNSKDDLIELLDSDVVRLCISSIQETDSKKPSRGSAKHLWPCAG